jgi:hypothetical protein
MMTPPRVLEKREWRNTHEIQRVGPFRFWRGLTS